MCREQNCLEFFFGVLNVDYECFLRFHTSTTYFLYPLNVVTVQQMYIGFNALTVDERCAVQRVVIFTRNPYAVTGVPMDLFHRDTSCVSG